MENPYEGRYEAGLADLGWTFCVPRSWVELESSRVDICGHVFEKDDCVLP